MQFGDPPIPKWGLTFFFYWILLTRRTRSIPAWHSSSQWGRAIWRSPHSHYFNCIPDNSKRSTRQVENSEDLSCRVYGDIWNWQKRCHKQADTCYTLQINFYQLHKLRILQTTHYTLRTKILTSTHSTHFTNYTLHTTQYARCTNFYQVHTVHILHTTDYTLLNMFLSTTQTTHFTNYTLHTAPAWAW